MARATTEALEVNRFIAGLKELLATGQGTLIERSRKQEDVALHERERMVGWIDDEGVYLIPNIAIERVRKMFGPQSLTVSLQALYNQFEGLHLIAVKGKDKVTRPMRIWGTLNRVLHLVPDVLETRDDTEEADDEQDPGALATKKLGL
jgi:hypothetical protein